MLSKEFDFFLPKQLVASRPLKNRDHSRLLILHRDGSIEHRFFYHILNYLKKGDLIIINDTKVFPARLLAKKPSGGILDVLLKKEIEKDTWEVLYRGNYEGYIYLNDVYKLRVWTEKINGTKEVKKYLKFSDIKNSDIYSFIWTYGLMPLPKYIGRLPDEKDKDTYQTVYAKKVGSIAAPTAGLHFTESLIEEIKKIGVNLRTLTLHVGTGTFRLIKSDLISNHQMEAEFFEIELSLIQEIEQTKKRGNKIIAVGTTSTRALEGYMSGCYRELAKKQKGKEKIYGYTDIFIYPGYQFKAINSLITNFHLPRSTPLLLVAALSTKEKIFKAYEEAISKGYRFFSYGDAMLIL
ncbi:MAG: tRNA preQ1(34) S-adenosylmethionine ribosyltransferase-isomerase QueA [Thermodesulfovibrionales bacterium]|nr:tRNA preQ1(34) S-adenosylmethionine ribosyltransferase-isomerase QueA [Thermodesulfovibrionales bacterium]